MPLSQRALMWLLGGLAGLLALLTLGAVGAVWLSSTPSARKPAAAAKPAAAEDPAPAETLRVGMAAPDFALPDDTNHFRRLAEFDGKPSVLLFLCGCSRCYLMVRALHETEKELRGETPRHIVVTTMYPGEARQWQKRTGFYARFLFEKGSHGPVIQQYAGHPCPRVYILDNQRTIRYISPSPKGDVDPEKMIAELTAGLRAASTPGSDRSPAPAQRHADAK